MARLSTHVLDTSRGVPATGVAIDLHLANSSGVYHHVQSFETNVDGRAAGVEVVIGNYELIFHAGDYFRRLQLPLTDPPFLDRIGIRFGIADVHSNYHVPLLLSPYGYSTYRGS